MKDIQPLNSKPLLNHHRLRVWHEAMSLVKLVHQNRICDAELRDQATRASKSVALNIAEAAAFDGALAKKHFRIARASTVETVAAYELAVAIGESVPAEAVTQLGTVVASMLTGLILR